MNTKTNLLIEQQRIVDTSISFNSDSVKCLSDIFKQRKEAAIMYQKAPIDSKEERLCLDIINYCNDKIKLVIGL